LIRPIQISRRWPGFHGRPSIRCLTRTGCMSARPFWPSPTRSRFPTKVTCPILGRLSRIHRARTVFSRFLSRWSPRQSGRHIRPFRPIQMTCHRCPPALSRAPTSSPLALNQQALRILFLRQPRLQQHRLTQGGPQTPCPRRSAWPANRLPTHRNLSSSLRRCPPVPEDSWSRARHLMRIASSLCRVQRPWQTSTDRSRLTQAPCASGARLFWPQPPPPRVQQKPLPFRHR